MAPKVPRQLMPIIGITCVTGLFWTSYKMFYKPFVHQKELQEAEAYAEFIFRREQKARESVEQ